MADVARRTRIAAAVAMIHIAAWTLVAAPRAGELAVDDVMHQKPRLVIPSPTPVFSPRLMPLWLEALARPDAETRRLAAGTIVVAMGRGMRGLETAREPLRAVLRDDADSVVRRAAAQALVAIGARDAAADLAAAAAQEGLLMAQIVEPALAKWDYQPLRSRWLERLRDPATPRALRLLAIAALSEVREERAVEPLRAIVRQREMEAPFRLAAARALGEIREHGLADLAVELSGGGQSPAAFERLLAAQLLGRHRDAKTGELLAKLAADAEPTVARPALERLNAIDVSRARAIAGPALQSGDAALRAVAATIVAAREDVAGVRLLRSRLADRNPGVRRFVAARFVEFGGREQLRPAVLEESQAALADEPWRGLEQAALILGTMDHEPAAPRLMELLGHARAEVAVSSAWALRKLCRRDTLPALLQHATAVHARLGRPDTPLHAGRLLSQLFQWFGEEKYRDAEPLLRHYVPKSLLDGSARMSACWALGRLHENEPDCDLAAVFAERLADVASDSPELNEVRLMTAIGLGYMRAKSQLEMLRKFAEWESGYTPTGAACRWSIERITGEKPLETPPWFYHERGWFLEPTSG